MDQVFIVIPAYNESDSLKQVLVDLLAINYRHIVIVDDGSSCPVSEIIRDFPVHIVTHSLNLGQGAALRTGTEYALQNGAEIVVHFDADGQHRAAEIADLVQVIAEGYDVALGSRFLHARQHVPKTKKYFILKPAIYVNWLFSGLKLSDAHNGFRALSRHAAGKIIIEQNRMAHGTEIVAEIKKHNLKFKEVPVEIIYHEYGQNFSGGIKVVMDLIKQKFFN